MIEIESGVIETANPTVLIQNVFADGSLTASTAATDFDAANAISGGTYDGWKPTAMPATLEVSLGASANANCLGVAAHNLGASNATLIVEYDTGGGWTEAASHTPTDDTTIIILFPAVSADNWRIRITGATEPTIGFIMLGERLVFPAGIVGDYTPTNWGGEIEILGGETRGGQFLGQRVVKRGAEARVSIGRVLSSWAQTNALPFFDHYNTGKAFFFAGWPSGLPLDVALCWRGEGVREIRPSISQGDWVSISFDARCYVGA